MPNIGDPNYEAWYELGAPVSIPLLKYIISVIQYLVDNFFLIKNTLNALQGTDDLETSEPYSSKIWVAGSTVGLHIFSSILISIIDSFNKEAISGIRRTRSLSKRRRLAFFRVLAHVTLTMKLFRYTTAYLENRRKNKELHILRMRRTVLSRKEIRFIVDQKKNNLVESHYDIVESFFKTIPAALLQVYFMFKTNPDARLRLFSTTDQDRFATVFFTIITASVAAVNYQFSYMEYKKVLHFQDCFRSGFQQKMNLQIPGNFCFASSIVAQIATIGIRMCFYSVILFWSPKQFLITISLLLLFNWILIYKWNKTTWRLRAVLENPLYGAPWPIFDIIDLWINLFVPGVHYPKPLDHFLNFYTTTFIGVVVFKSFDFLFPTSIGSSPEFFSSEDANSRNNTTGISFLRAFESYDVNLKLNVTHEGAKGVDEETVYFMGMLIKYLMLIHDNLTLNQISYIHFFYNVVKYMNIVNVICLLYTFAMNLFKLYDLDFPIQIANNFFHVVIESLNQPNIPKVDGLFIQTRKAEIFLLYFILPNVEFFSRFPMFKNTSWKSIDDESFNEILYSVKPVSGPKPKPSCFKQVQSIFIKIYQFVSPVLYPDRFREPELNWDVSTQREEVEESIKNQPLKLQSQLLKLIHLIHEYGDDENGKLLLAVFCANYNEIVRHFTSLRIKRTFKFMEIPLEKTDAYHNHVGDAYVKKYFEIGYWGRLLKEMKGDVERYVWEFGNDD